MSGISFVEYDTKEIHCDFMVVAFHLLQRKFWRKTNAKPLYQKMRKPFYLRIKGLFNPLSEIKGSIIELSYMYLKAKCIPGNYSTL